MDMHFDFQKSATRKSILEQLCNQFSAEEHAYFESKRKEIVFPNKHHHNLDDVMNTLDNLELSEYVHEHMSAVYNILAHAEAAVHETTLENTHFHEVGRAEGIKNVFDICLAFEILHPEFVTATPVQVGSGTVICAHGEMEIPAPATAHILNSGIPICKQHKIGELCTPTSAAIIKHFVDKFYLGKDAICEVK